MYTDFFSTLLVFYHRLFNLLRPDIVQKTATGTSKLSINRSHFRTYRLPYFDYEYQVDSRAKIEAIAKILDEFSAQLDEQSVLLNRLRQQILREAIEGKLTAEWRREHRELTSGNNHASKLLEKIRAERAQLIKQGEIRKKQTLPPIDDGEKPFTLPEEWIWCRLGDLGITQTGNTPSTTHKANFGDYIPFIKPADITIKGIDYHNQGLSENGLAVGRMIPSDSLLMVCIGGSTGKAYFTNRDIACNQQINAITPLADIEAPFLLQFLQSSYFQDKVWSKAMKSSTPIISKARWESIPVPLPPELEQRVILERTGQILTHINESERRVIERQELSAKLLQAVLREAFAMS